VDTAGIRASLDEAENMGIKKSLETLADADLVLVVLDASQQLSSEDEELIAQAAKRSAIVIENKSDLTDSRNAGSKLVVSEVEEIRLASRPHRDEALVPQAPQRIPTSALTGEGIPELRDAILHQVTGDAAAQSEAGFLTSARHQALVSNSLKGLAAAESAVQSQIPHEMLLLDLYGALRPLDEITGATTTDDILNLIFSTFCIGK